MQQYEKLANNDTQCSFWVKNVWCTVVFFALQFALLSWSTAYQKNHIRKRLSCLSPLIILLIFLKRQEITIFLPHSHMPSHLIDVCDECVSILAHLQLQCIDRAITPCALQMRPCVFWEISQEENDLWVWKQLGEMRWVISEWHAKQSVNPYSHSVTLQWLSNYSRQERENCHRKYTINMLHSILTPCRRQQGLIFLSWK